MSGEDPIPIIKDCLKNFLHFCGGYMTLDGVEAYVIAGDGMWITHQYKCRKITTFFNWGSVSKIEKVDDYSFDVFIPDPVFGRTMKLHFDYKLPMIFSPVI